ncbi:MAG: deoxyribodipyrimidine photo-lyase [Roseovarius sp.]|nr:deoxyribodipyrimidine photo-lyase [Roseovarius sp.]
MKEAVICWFKRDLRGTDHPALARAAVPGPVIPLCIVEPEGARDAVMRAPQVHVPGVANEGLPDARVPGLGDTCPARRCAVEP